MLKKITTVLLLVLPFVTHAEESANCQANTRFNLGAGIYDITGPAAEDAMMGYGMSKQKTAGIYQRLWARAFIIESPCNGKRIVFVNADLGQLFQGVKQQVIKKLQNKFGSLYQDENVLLTATHTHSGPGGYSSYFFYNITSLGTDPDNINVIVNGIVNAIERAHQNMQAGRIKIATGTLTGVNFNRSPTAYQANPVAERALYSNDTDVEMTLLRLESESGKPIGMINWFPIHGTSMNNKNTHISGDNKGYAAYLFEKDFASDHGEKAFVAAFAQANAGDVTPNPNAHEGGEGAAGLAAVERAGRPQYEKARTLFNQATELLQGAVDYRHQFVQMDRTAVYPKHADDGNAHRTCPAAIGISMLAGTHDGEGFGRQGITCAHVSDVLSSLRCEMATTHCQGVKPIALTTGNMFPYPWTPNILPMQLVKIGSLAVAALPFEPTTMAGRRIKQEVKENLPEDSHGQVVISGLANAYAGYVTSYEEYQLQRYEGASTHFGPWTLAAIQQNFAQLAHAISFDKALRSGPMPDDLSGSQIHMQSGVVSDKTPQDKQFGDIYQDVKPDYRPGETIEVVFWGGHPKNNLRTQDTFLTVEKMEQGEWKPIRTDNDWDTTYHWERNGLDCSLVTISWRVPKDQEPGQYRIVHYGDWKSFWTRKVTAYSGHSSVFHIIE